MRLAASLNAAWLGSDHPDVAANLGNLSGLLQDEGNYAGAEPLFRRSLAINEKALGPDDPKTQKIRSNLESLKSKMPTQKSEK